MEVYAVVQSWHNDEYGNEEYSEPLGIFKEKKDALEFIHNPNGKSYSSLVILTYFLK